MPVCRKFLNQKFNIKKERQNKNDTASIEENKSKLKHALSKQTGGGGLGGGDPRGLEFV